MADQIISAAPEIREAKLGPDARFVLFGCDGIWERIDNEGAVSMVSEFIKNATPEQLARKSDTLVE